MSSHKVEHTLETVIRVMKVFNGFDGPSSDELWWRTDEEYAPLTLFVNCNDLFLWGYSDAEELGPEDLDVLDTAFKDALEVDGLKDAHHLYVARKRGMRPQGAYYKYFAKGIRPLFDACGPEREVGMGNPESNIVVEKDP